MCEHGTETWAEKAGFVQRQIRETVQQTKDGVPVRLATITCRCGRERSIMLMYQCLYCKEWYCDTCAEQHFGQTVAEYREQHPISETYGT